MGLFDFICDCFESARDWVEEKVEDLVENVRDGISNVIDAIAPIESEKPYDGGSADIHTTDRLSDILREASEKYTKSAVAVEKACIREVERYYDKLMPMVESSYEFGCSKSAIRKIKNNREVMRKSINGSIEVPLRKRLSLDDRKCLEILKLEAGKAKKAKMDSFVKAVIKEAQDNLASEVKKSLDMQMNDIEEAFSEMEEKKEKEFKNLMETFKRFSDSNANDTGAKERNCVLPLVLFETTEEVLRLLA